MSRRMDLPISYAPVSEDTKKFTCLRGLTSETKRKKMLT
jgi:hypothetical protein